MYKSEEIESRLADEIGAEDAAELTEEKVRANRLRRICLTIGASVARKELSRLHEHARVEAEKKQKKAEVEAS